jgi:hypothetical protein
VHPHWAMEFFTLRCLMPSLHNSRGGRSRTLCGVSNIVSGRLRASHSAVQFSAFFGNVLRPILAHKRARFRADNFVSLFYSI